MSFSLKDHNFCQMTFVRAIEKDVGSMSRNVSRLSDMDDVDAERFKKECELMDMFDNVLEMANELYNN